MKWEKTKKVALVAAIFLLIRHEQFIMQCRDVMGIELLASPSAGAMRCGHASSCVHLCRRGWAARAPEFA
jgi:hypothetical protein